MSRSRSSSRPRYTTLACVLSVSAIQPAGALVSRQSPPNNLTPQQTRFDVILSSGFLCFSRHAGFAASLEDLGLNDRIDRYVGTSSGALAASMLAAGLSASEVAGELSSRRPISECRVALKPWRGVMSTRALQRRLSNVLPPTFEDLQKPLAVGVYDVKTREPKLISSGPLVPAVAASVAVPNGMFSPVRLADGHLYADGGALDRTFVRQWRQWDSTGKPARRALVHLISSEPAGVFADRDGIPDDHDQEGQLLIVRSPRTTGKLWSLGDFDGEVNDTRHEIASELLSSKTSKELVGDIC